MFFISGDKGGVIYIISKKAIAVGTGELRRMVLLERGGGKTLEGFTAEWTNQMAAYAWPEAGLGNG